MLLSPAISEVENALTSALNEILQIDNYAFTCTNLRIGKLDKDPDWLATARERIGMFSSLGSSWINDRPDIWSSVLVQFPDYASAFASLATVRAQGKADSSAACITLLKQVLRPQLQQAAAVTGQAIEKLETHYNDFRNRQGLLQESINQGWAELADEERQMVAIAEKLGELQATVNDLEQEITADAISGGKDYTSSAVSICYELVSTAGASVPYLSIASLAFTVGKSFYDLIADSQKVDDLLEQIGALQLEASDEAQAAAGTKGVLQTFYELEKSFLAIKDDVLPAILTMWRNELDKVGSVVEALEAGAEPDECLSIVTIPTSNANWNQIGRFATDTANLQRTMGKPVTLTPGLSNISSLTKRRSQP